MTSPNEDPSDTQGDNNPGPDDLGVIVCAYTDERWQDICEVIESLQNQTPKAGEIVLVIDHNDDLFEKAKETFASKITIVKNEETRGLSGARNSGIKNSKAAILAFVDDDAVANSGWVAGILSSYENDHVVGVGGQINPVWLGGRPKWWPTEFDWVIGCTYKGHTQTRSQIRNAIGANMSVRRNAFDAVGGFSQGLGRVGKRPIGAEETELYIRINQWRPDLKVMFEPSAMVEHKVPTARGTVSYFVQRCYAEGLSKAVVSRLVGQKDGLSAERNYTSKVLPTGAIQGIKDLLKGDFTGLLRTGAIVLGLIATTVGYARGKVTRESL